MTRPTMTIEQWRHADALVRDFWLRRLAERGWETYVYRRRSKLHIFTHACGFSVASDCYEVALRLALTASLS